MKIKLFILVFIISSVLPESFSQNSQPEKSILGFVRAGLYGSTDKTDDKISIPSAFTDIAVKFDLDDGKKFKAYMDVRFRYGTEFNELTRDLNLREAYVGLYGKNWEIIGGQQIIKWGKTDFTSSISKLSSRNLVSRSPDPEDMDMGNLLLRARWYPFPILNLELVAGPYYRPSVLMIEPIKLPSFIAINKPEALLTGPGMFSYAFRSDLHFSFADIGISWFKGYDPMPGTKLTSLNLDMTSGIPVPATVLTLTPYKIQNAGIDFEATAGSFGIRGELTLSIPEKSYKEFEFIACKQTQWVIGIDRSIARWRIIAEYSGKYLPGFEPSAVDPIIGTEPDPEVLAILMSTPGFDLQQFVKQQVNAFNRLYNYQLEKQYNSCAIKIERDLLYGMMTPSLIAMFNITTGDLLLRPELVYKPADGITINLGGELFSGKKGSIYDIVDEYLNSVFVSIKAEF